VAYIVSCGDRRFKIDARRVDSRSIEEIFEVGIDGEKKLVSIARVSPTHLSVLVDNLSYDIEVETFEGKYQVSIRGEVYCFDVMDEREMITHAISHEAGEAIISAPMPGLVIEVMVEKGEAVKKKDKLLILEAMKMQNEIVAPRDGEVAELNIKPGDSVNTGDRLVIIR